MSLLRFARRLAVCGAVWIAAPATAEAPPVVARIAPEQLRGGASFGWPVLLDGDLLAIGAAYDDAPFAAYGGAIYVFARDAGGADNWGEVAKITSEDGLDFISSGLTDSALSGVTLAMSFSRYYDQPAEVWIYDGNWNYLNYWERTRVLTLPSCGSSPGPQIALSGDTLAAREPCSGAIRLFERNVGGPGNWGEVASVSVGGAAWNGAVFDLDGDRLVAGLEGSAEAQVWDRIDGVWSQTALLSVAASAPEWNLLEVSLDGDRVALLDQEDGIAVFEKATNGSGAWNQAAELAPVGLQQGDFLWNLALDGSDLYVIYERDSLCSGGVCPGSTVESFARVDGVWGAAGSAIGPASWLIGLAAERGRIVVSNPYEDHPLAQDTGAAYVYERVEQLYYSEPEAGEIRRTRGDGYPEQTLVVDDQLAPRAVAVDDVAQKIYWAEEGGLRIARANLDGSEVETAMSTTSMPFDVEVDVAGGKLYWSEPQIHQILRANLDGSDLEVVVAGGYFEFPGAFGMDSTRGVVFWNNRNGNNGIYRLELGTGISEIVALVGDDTADVDVDPATGDAYWTAWDQVIRYRADAGSTEVVVGGQSGVAHGLVVDHSSESIYAATTLNASLHRWDFDGFGATIISGGTLANPWGLARSEHSVRPAPVPFRISLLGPAGSVLNEAGSQLDFGVRLSDPSPEWLIVPLSTADTEVCWLLANELYVAPGETMAQTMVIPTPNYVPDGTRACDVSFGPVQSADANYAGQQLAAFSVPVHDDDGGASIVHFLAEGITVSEGGGDFYLQFGLDRAPIAPVHLPIRSTDPANATISVAELILDESNVWNEWETAFLQPVADCTVDGDAQLQIELGPVTSDDPRFDGLVPAPIAVTVLDVASPDTDGDGIENLCDADDDNDGVADGSDDCPLVANADQADYDGDGIGDVCDTDPPQGFGTSYSVDEDTPMAITLTGSPNGGGPISFAIADSPAHGTLSGTAPNVIYTPTQEYNGLDTFSFTVSNERGTSSPSTIVLDVLWVNDAPVADPQTIVTAEETPKAIVLTGSDIDSPSLQFAVASNPAHGTLSPISSVNPPTVTYTPAPDYFGPDSFTFTSTDNITTSAPATVSITVTPVNDPPTANPQSVSTAEDTPLAITLTGGDVDGTQPAFAVIAPPSHGTLTGTPPNLTFIPAANYGGADSFGFQASDGQATSLPALVSISLVPVNDAPVANAQSVGTNEDTPVAIVLTGFDVEGTPLAYSIVSPPTRGTLSGSGPNRTYSPSANLDGADSFAFTVSDGQTTSAAATVAVTVASVNDAPAAVDDSGTTRKNTAVAIAVAANDSDLDGDPLAVISTTAPTKGGTVAILSGGTSVRFTPKTNFIGVDTFNYTVSDGQGGTSTATVTVTVTK